MASMLVIKFGTKNLKMKIVEEVSVYHIFLLNVVYWSNIEISHGAATILNY